MAKREIRKDVEECFKKYDEKYKDLFSKESERIKISLTKDINSLEADKARIFALHCASSQHWGSAAIWWSVALIRYIGLNYLDMIRNSVDALLDCIKKPNWDRKPGKRELNIIKLAANKIPNILKKEKDKILKIVNKAIKSKSEPEE